MGLNVSNMMHVESFVSKTNDMQVSFDVNCTDVHKKPLL